MLKLAFMAATLSFAVHIATAPAAIPTAESNPTGLVVKAADFAARKHGLQKLQDDSNPYIVDPIAVAYNLAAEQGVKGANMIAAAFIFKTPEKAQVKSAELDQEFGQAIRCLVLGCADSTPQAKEVHEELKAAFAATPVQPSGKKFEPDATSNPIGLIVKAANFAARYHGKQMRKDKSNPYIVHPIGVAYVLTEIGEITDANVIAAGLLHDTVEDTKALPEDIEREFGSVIRKLVDECSDDKKQPKDVRKINQIEHAAATSDNAKLVKLADKLHNLRELSKSRPEGWNDDRIAEYWEWSSKVVRNLRFNKPPANKKIADVLATLFLTKKITL